jgi:hypothetical protein
MMGRAVLVLCALTSTALACPSAYESDDSTGAAVAFALMGLCVFAYAITRGNAVRRTFATSHHLVEVDLETMKRVAGLQRTRTGWVVLVCALLVSGFALLPLDLHARLWLSASPAIMFVVTAFAWCQLQMLLWLQPEPGLRAASHGDYMFVSRGKRLVGWVAAPPSLIAKASSLPIATLRH